MNFKEEIKKKVSRASYHFSIATALSRATGFLREMAMAAAFGVNSSVAAFLVAYRFANLARRLLGESALSAAFIPRYEAFKTTEEEAALCFFQDVRLCLTYILIALILIGELAIWGFLKWTSFSPGNTQILQLTSLMLPALLFICLASLNSALLQAKGHFFLIGIAPVGCNIVWILCCAAFFRLPMARAMECLSWGIIVAYAAQWVLTLPPLRVLLRGCRINWWPFTKAVRLLLKPVLLGIAGISASQLNSALDMLFARAADATGPAYLWYALRLQQLPLALFGIALSSAILPSFSRSWQKENYTEYNALLVFGIVRAFSLMIPASVAFAVMGKGVVSLFFGMGGFGQEAVFKTAGCLWAYGLGLFPATAVFVLAGALYAKNQYKSCTQAAITAVVCNITLNAIFVFGCQMSSISVAIATSLSSFVNMAQLAFLLRKELFADCSWLLSVLKIFLCSLVGGGVCLIVGYLLNDPLAALKESLSLYSLWNRLFLLMVEGSSFIIALAVTALLIRSQELKDLIFFLKRAEKKSNS